MSGNRLRRDRKKADGKQTGQREAGHGETPL
jgi:hypothetical protein